MGIFFIFLSVSQKWLGSLSSSDQRCTLAFSVLSNRCLWEHPAVRGPPPNYKKIIKKISQEQKRQDDLVASVYLPVTSTPLRSSRSPPVTPPFAPVVAPSAGLSPVVKVVGDSPIAPLPHRSVSVPLHQLQFGPQICDEYPGCPSHSDSSDEMSELDDSEVDDISKDDDELRFLAKRFLIRFCYGFFYIVYVHARAENIIQIF